MGKRKKQCGGVEGIGTSLAGKLKRSTNHKAASSFHLPLHFIIAMAKKVI
jgi:hypothetical protein